VALDSRTPFAAPYMTRGQHVKGVRYFGPFVDVRAVRATMDELLQAFPLRRARNTSFSTNSASSDRAFSTTSEVFGTLRGKD